MIVQTPTIVLKRFPYGDTSVIAHCFTREYGKISIMVRGAQRKKSPRSAYFQPANYLETLFYYKPNRELHTLSKVSFLQNWIRFHDDLKRISYALAAVELVEKTITDHDPHEELFDELVSTLLYFHEEETRYNLCFWYFELRLLSLLGYQPHFQEREFPGHVLPDPAAGPNSLAVLEFLIHADARNESFKSDLHKMNITPKDRRVIANYINANLEYHFESCRHLKSIKILKQLLT